MQWVRAACVRPAPSMRVCARSYLGRASIAKTVVDIFATTSIQKSVCLSAQASRVLTKNPTNVSRPQQRPQVNLRLGEVISAGNHILHLISRQSQLKAM